MKKLLLVPYSFLFILFFNSCSDNANTLPRYTGTAGEIVVVAENHIWESELGQAIQDHFYQHTPHLPQPEAKFYLGQYPYSGFNNLLKQHRNILLIKIDNKLPKTEVNMLRSKWSKGQLVVQLNALNLAEAKEAFHTKKEQIIKLFNEAEIERLKQRYYNNTNDKVSQLLKEKFNISMHLPADMLIAQQHDTSSNVIWLNRERIKYLSGVAHDITQGIVVYALPYQSDSIFTNEFAAKIRNQAVKVVQGSSADKRMTTEIDFYPPEGKFIRLNGKTARLTTGLWKMTNDFMGGPFVNLLILDEKNQLVIGIDGFVFAPKFNKREYVREMEAMLKSAQLIEK